MTAKNGEDSIPEGVPPVLSVRGAAAALGIDQRQMLGWVVRDFVPGAFQVAEKGKYWIPGEAVRRLAEKFLVEPDWNAAIDVDG